MLILCPTADYEIYLGRNLLPIEEVLFEPTAKLLDVWDEFDVRATLFPDVCSVWRHRQEGLVDYVEAFEEQVREFARRGHDVQLHLHPEWSTAERESAAWHFQPGTGSLHDRGFDPDDVDGAPQLIRQGRDYLTTLLRPLDANYECMAFRAGGWILQPESPLVAALLDAGIHVDATVIPGVRLLRTDYRVDFRDVPDRPNWFVSAQGGLACDSQDRSDLFEISIAAYRGRFAMWQHVVNELRMRRRARAKPQKFRGYPIVKAGPRLGALQRVRRKFRKLNVPRVLDAADTFESMRTTLNSYLRRYDCRAHDFAVCINGHPKDTYDHHLDELRRFLDHVKARHADVVQFDTLRGTYQRLVG